MAFATSAHASVNPLSAIAGLFRSVGASLVKLAEANSRVKAAQHLMSLSDKELAARGMKREDIVKHVFGDIMYI